MDSLNAASSPLNPKSGSPVPTRHQCFKKLLFHLALFTFSILEAGYIALGAICLTKHIPLRVCFLKLTDSEVQGGYADLVVFWQNIALVCGGYLAEAIYRDELRPGKDKDKDKEKEKDQHKDKASVLVCLGFIDERIAHLLGGTATNKFILALLASLFFFLLNTLAPGAINAAPILINSPMTIQIGRLLSNPADNNIQEVVTADHHASLILRLEKIQNSPFRFNLPDNMLMAVPKVDLASFNGMIEYSSDIIEFHHDCHWEALQFSRNTSDGMTVTTAAGQQWRGATVGDGFNIKGSSIGPLSFMSFPIMEQVGIPAFIFSGGNSTTLFPSNPPTPFSINLGSLPVTLTPSGVGANLVFNRVYAPLSTILICDPHTKITGGRIKVTNNGTLTIVASGETPIGNIPLSAANFIFNNASQAALTHVEPLANNGVNNIASNMFMSNATVDWNTAVNIHLLDLPSINKNMDTYMLSVAKAFIGGYNRIGTSTAVTFTLDTVPAMGQRSELALSTSKKIFITTVAVFVVVTILLLLLHELTSGLIFVSERSHSTQWFIIVWLKLLTLQIKRG